MSASDRLERILADDYVDDLGERPIDEVRAMRDECIAEEDGVSYGRRIVQGKHDIARAELANRRDEGDKHARALLSSLPAVLRDRPTGSPGRPAHRAVRLFVPESAQHHAEAAERFASAEMARLHELTSEELADLIGRLHDEERRLSSLRRELFTRIDALQAELTARYKSGSADVTEVLPHDAG